MIEEKDILNETHYGLNIYAHILRKYYPEDVVISLSGSVCSKTKNPFNDNRVTLNIFKQDGAFCFNDSEKPDFKGNPFDFAAIHYNLNGEELRKKLNHELNLKIGEDWDFYDQKRKENTAQRDQTGVVKFSYYKCPVTNTIPYCEANLFEVYLVIKSDLYKAQTVKLRSILSPLPFGEGSGERLEQARKYKARQFDYVTFSGTLTKRNENALIQHSGLVTIDFDHVPDLPQLKHDLLNDEYFETELMFVSPSGDGLKWIISIDLTECSHQQWFKAIAAYIKATYQLEVDKSGKDISRACFLPHDPEVYINPNFSQKSLKTESHETL